MSENVDERATSGPVRLPDSGLPAVDFRRPGVLQFHRDENRHSEGAMSDIEVVLTGLVYVFAVLALMILLIAGVSFAVRAVERARGKKRVKNIVPVPDDTPRDGAKNEETRSSGQDEEVVAAIAAAVAAYRDERTRPRFRILSFKRIGRD